MTTLRLLFPQWQGGNNPAYTLGAELLAWLAPNPKNEIQITVPVDLYDGSELPVEGGVVGRSVLLRQLNSAGKIIEAYNPDKIIVFGGDCLVSQAPFAFLNEKYGGNLGVLWIDTHPDVSTPAMFYHEHAMVLGNLLGEGDPSFSAEVKVPLKPENIMYAGLQKTSADEAEIVSRLNLRQAAFEEITENRNAITDWIKNEKIKHLAIHFDLDALDPVLFRSLLFAQPDGTVIDAPSGKMTLPQIGRIINDVSEETDVVSLSIAEHLPWDAINLRDFLASLSVFKE